MRSSDVLEHASPNSSACLPTWFVSTAYATARRESGAEAIRRPYGIQHARQVGSYLTACGLGAFGWELFWEAAFPSESPSTCEECVRAVTQADVPPAQPCPVCTTESAADHASAGR
jgi:hypothetical protein